MRQTLTAPGRFRRSLIGTLIGVVALGVLPVGAVQAQTAAPLEPIPVDSLCVNVAPGYDPFDDVDDDHTFAATIRCMALAEITFGVTEARYAPGQAITRAQMASFLARMLDRAVDLQVDDDLVPLPAYDGENVFDDVAPNNVHLEAINRVQAVGITEGGPGDLPASSYGPDLPVARGQMASFIANALEHLTGVPRSTDDDFFTDDDASPHEGSINVLAEAGIVVGVGDGRFLPGADLNRGQMSAFIMRSLAEQEIAGVIAPIPVPEPDLPTSLVVTEDAIADQDGNVLLSAAVFPETVEPEPGTEFGGPTRFEDAVLSGDQRWIAIGTSGVAHSYGWLYDVVADQLHFVAFQFEGSLSADSWSPDERFALFTIGTPAGTGLLKIVDRGDVGPYPDDTGFVVEVEAEAGVEPPFAYEEPAWQAPHTLCFDFEGERSCVNADTREVSAG
jgi:hypothetical protein